MLSSEHCTYTKKMENPNPSSMTCCGPRNLDTRIECNNFWTVIRFKTVESGTFRFCGREVIQHSDFSVSIKCKDTTEKIEPVRYDPKKRKQTDLARDHEIAQLRSVVGSLAWVAWLCKPQLSYGVNKLQSVCGTATLDDLRFANNCCKKPRNHRTTDCSSKADFSPGTKLRCSPCKRKRVLSQTESKSPCGSVLPWLMRMVCSCVQIGNITPPVSCVMYG